MPDFISLLTQFVNPTILIACLVLGFVVKNWIADANNQIIPTLVFIVGMILSVIIALTGGQPITVDVFVMGAISGLASTGLHQMLKTWLNNLNN